MADVVQLRPKEEPCIWVCNCGCVTFRHYVDGGIECASCGIIATGPTGEWLTELPDPPAVIPQAEHPSYVSTHFKNGEARAALEMMLRRAMKYDETARTVAVAVIYENGRVQTWGGVNTEKQARWLRRKLKDVQRLLTEFVEPNGSN